MKRVIAVLGLIVLLLIGIYFAFFRDNGKAQLQIRHHYLLVSIEAPPKWIEEHSATIRWKGKTITLPVVFRLSGTVKELRWGAEPEFYRSLDVRGVRVPVEVQPHTEFRVSNEGPVPFIREPGQQKGVVALSTVAWVTVGPLERPGKLSPTVGEDAVLAAGRDIEAKVHALLANGQVIDVESDQ